MKSFNTIWNYTIKIWKDPVWSKVISTGIILLIASIWTKYNNFTTDEIYNFVVSILSFKIPIFIFLSLVGLYFIVILFLKAFKRKSDSIWDEQIGNYKFKELYKILSSQNYPVGTTGMGWSGRKPPEDNLLILFHTYSPILNKGITIEDRIDDGGYLYGVLAPKLVGYGLVDKTEIKNPHLENIMDNKYQTSELGHKFFAQLEKVFYLKKNEDKNKFSH